MKFETPWSRPDRAQATGEHFSVICTAVCQVADELRTSGLSYVYHY